jgi:hypothetical protein
MALYNPSLSFLFIVYRNTLENVMDFDGVVKKRRMIRKYEQDREISTDIINKLLRKCT